MTKYSVDTDLLNDQIADMTRFESLLDRQLEALDKAVADLHITWEGEAAAAHKTAHREWSEGAAAMRTALTAMRDAARIAHGNYHSAVHANQRMWDSVT